MRVNTVSANNYSNGVVPAPKNRPSFEANVYTSFQKNCLEGQLCDSALNVIAVKFLKTAISNGKILLDNVAFGFTYPKTEKFEFYILDKTSQLFKDIMKNPQEFAGKNGYAKLAQKIKDDVLTEKIALNIKETEYCPNAPYIRASMN